MSSRPNRAISLGDGLVHLLAIGHVDLDAEGIAAVRHDLGHDVIDRVRVEADRDGRAVGGQAERDGAPEPEGSARDERDPPCLLRHAPPLSELPRDAREIPGRRASINRLATRGDHPGGYGRAGPSDSPRRLPSAVRHGRAAPETNPRNRAGPGCRGDRRRARSICARAPAFGRLGRVGTSAVRRGGRERRTHSCLFRRLPVGGGRRGRDIRLRRRPQAGPVHCRWHRAGRPVPEHQPGGRRPALRGRLGRRHGARIGPWRVSPRHRWRRARRPGRAASRRERAPARPW